MAHSIPKFNTLTEDLTDLVVNWKDNSKRTEAQLKQWPSEKLMEFLGKDPKNGIRLLKSDGFDDLPVMANHLNAEIIEKIANREIIRFSDNDICRLALFFHLNQHHAFIMMIKSRWEQMIEDKIKSIKIEYYTNSPEADQSMLPFMGGVSKVIPSMLETIDKAFGTNLSTSDQKELYQSIIDLFMITRSFFFPILSKETEAFIGNQDNLMNTVRAENKAYNDIFHARHKQWVDLIQGAELSHLKLEEQRLKNNEIEKEWLIHFGSVYCNLLQFDFKYQSLRRQIDIKKEYPAFTREELIQADKEALELDRQKLIQFENDLRMSEIAKMAFSPENAEKGKVDAELLNKFKKALRTIWLKTHPDRLIDNLFSPKQLKKLNDYYIQATELSTGERIANPRTLERLEQMIDEIEQIYKNMGIDLPLNATVQGITMKEKVGWLEKQIAQLENEISILKNEYYNLSTDGTINQKSESLKTPEIIESVKKQMLEKLSALEQECSKLKEELDSLF